MLTPAPDGQLELDGLGVCQVRFGSLQKPPVRLEFLILSLNPGLGQRCVAPSVWPTTTRCAATRR